MYLLDTNVISELRKINANKADENVQKWAHQVSPQVLFISVIAILELEIDILLKEHVDAKQGSILRAWLNDAVLPAFSGRILNLDLPVARRCAHLHVPLIGTMIEML